MEMEGAARLLAGWQFWKGREAEKRNVSPDLRNAMAAVVADSGQSDNLERFADTWREK
jgi:predicted negative regulator of RcsB-dependent stress response